MDISTTPATAGDVGADAADIAVDVSRAEQAFDAFYRDHAESIARALTVTLGDGDLAADATNEAMVRAYSHWTKISQYDNSAAWVYRVGLNWALSWMRRRRRDRERAAGLIPNAAELSDRDDSFDRALAQLTIDHRAVVVCRLHLDWSVAMTAEALDIAPGTVKSRLARALQQLRRSLPPEPTTERATG